MVETETYAIEGPDGSTKVLKPPASLIDVFAGQGEDPTDVIADMVVQAFAQQTHVVAHHSEGGAPADIAEISKQIEELLRDRFGIPLSNALGRSR